MNSEENRLRTFEKWPVNASVERGKLAKAGFYYTGREQEVQCFSCGGRISDWSYGDRVVAVITRHKELDPSCPFIKDPTAAGNLPLLSSQQRKISQESRSRDGEASGGRDVSQVSSNRPDVSRSSSTQDSPSCSPCISSSKCMDTEAARLATFNNWPVSFIQSQQLAKAGFSYTGYGDKVECFMCHCLVESWEEGDCPMDQHRLQNPDCPFLLSTTQGVHIRATSGSVPTSFAFNGEYIELKELGVQEHRIPRNPKYSTVESRLRSFKNHHWPPSIPQTPQQLADAGFYFTGRGDQVRCFHCDGGLRLWEKDDDPWVEHAKCFSDCGFLFLVRGQQFIDQALFLASVNNMRPSPVRAGSRGVKRNTEYRSPDLLLDSFSRESIPVRRIPVTDQQLQAAMNSSQALTALGVGLDSSRVKIALKRRLETTGELFSRAEDLISAAFAAQEDEAPDYQTEDRDEDVWSVSSSLAALLHSITMRATPPGSPIASLPPSKNRVSPRREAKESSSLNTSRVHSHTPSLPDVPHPANENSDADTISTGGSTAAAPACASTNHNRPHRSSQDTSINRPGGLSMSEMEEEMRKLKEWRQCKVCMDSEVGAVLLPCGHLVTCVHCTYSLTDCPLCRRTIEATVRTFLS